MSTSTCILLLVIDADLCGLDRAQSHDGGLAILSPDFVRRKLDEGAILPDFRSRIDGGHRKGGRLVAGKGTRGPMRKLGFVKQSERNPI